MSHNKGFESYSSSEPLIVLGGGFSQETYTDYKGDVQFKLAPRSHVRVVAAAALQPNEIIITGGHTKGQDHPSEAQAMLSEYYGILHSQMDPNGVQGPLQINYRLDDNSLDTIGNANHTGKVLEGLESQRVGLLTNEWHLPRSLSQFRRSLKRHEIVPVSAERVIKDNKLEDSVNLEKWKSRLLYRPLELALRILMSIDPQGKLIQKITSQRGK